MSFIAVKRDFIEPKDIPGVAIIPSALSMLASKSHRLKHTVWHTLRGVWNESWMDEESKTEIRQLGWGACGAQSISICVLSHPPTCLWKCLEK